MMVTVVVWAIMLLGAGYAPWAVAQAYRRWRKRRAAARRQDHEACLRRITRLELELGLREPTLLEQGMMEGLRGKPAPSGELDRAWRRYQEIERGGHRQLVFAVSAFFGIFVFDLSIPFIVHYATFLSH